MKKLFFRIIVFLGIVVFCLKNECLYSVPISRVERLRSSFPVMPSEEKQLDGLSSKPHIPVREVPSEDDGRGRKLLKKIKEKLSKVKDTHPKAVKVSAASGVAIAGTGATTLAAVGAFFSGTVLGAVLSKLLAKKLREEPEPEPVAEVVEAATGAAGELEEAAAGEKELEFPELLILPEEVNVELIKRTLSGKEPEPAAEPELVEEPEELPEPLKLSPAEEPEPAVTTEMKIPTPPPLPPVTGTGSATPSARTGSEAVTLAALTAARVFQAGQPSVLPLTEQSTTDEESPGKRIETILDEIAGIKVADVFKKYDTVLIKVPEVFFILEEQVQEMCDVAGVEKKKYGKEENSKVAILDKFKRMFSKKVLNQQKTDKQNFLNNVLNAAKSKVQEVIKKMWPDGVPENVEKFKENLYEAAFKGSNEMQEFYELDAVKKQNRTDKLIDSLGVFEQIKNAAMEVNKIKQAVKKEEK